MAIIKTYVVPVFSVLISVFLAGLYSYQFLDKEIGKRIEEHENKIGQREGSLSSIDVKQVIVDGIGPLPLHGKLVLAEEASVMFIATGSGFRKQEGGVVGMEVAVDRGQIGLARAFSNEVKSHKAFVTRAIVKHLKAGEHEVSLRTCCGTSTDENDFFSVTALIIPE